jgi:hypothetical protein
VSQQAQKNSVSQEATSRRRLVLLGVLFAYLLATSPLLILPALVGQPAVIGDPLSDVYVSVWEADWVFQSLTEQSAWPSYTDRINWPKGGTLVPQRPVFDLAAIGWRLIFGQAAAYNLAVWTLVNLGMFGAFMLARRLTGSSLGGLVAGIAFGASPFMMTYGAGSGAPEYLSLGLVSWALYFLHRALFRPNALNIALGAIALGAAISASAYVAMITGLFLAILFALLVAFGRKKASAYTLGDDKQDSGEPISWKGPAALLVVAALIAVGPTLAMVRMLDAPDKLIESERMSEDGPVYPYYFYQPGIDAYYAAGLADYLRPHVAVQEMGARFYKSVTLTFGAVLLALYGAIMLRARMKWPLILSALTLAMLSAGPYLLVTANFGAPAAINPVFLAAYHLVPGFKEFLEPFRFAPLVGLLVAMLAAAGSALLVKRYGNKGVAIVCGSLIAMGVEIVLISSVALKPENMAPLPPAPVLVATTVQSGLLPVEVPFFLPADPRIKLRFRYGNQVVHRRPDLDNVTGFIPRFARENGLVGRLISLVRPDMAGPVSESVAQGVQALAAAGVGALVINDCQYVAGGGELVAQVETLIFEAGLQPVPLDPCRRIARIEPKK